INVYAEPFPTDTGFRVYHSDRADLLVIRSEDLNRVFREAFADFLDVVVTELESHHVGDASDYGAAYSRFKAEVRFSTSFIDEQHLTPYATTFYTPAELRRARGLWGKKD